MFEINQKSCENEEGEKQQFILLAFTLAVKRNSSRSNRDNADGEWRRWPGNGSQTNRRRLYNFVLCICIHTFFRSNAQENKRVFVCRR